MNHALAVDHLADWTPGNWWLHYVGSIGIPVLAATLVAAGYLTFRATVRLNLPALLEAALAVILTACAFAAVFLGLFWHIDLLYETLRHTSSARHALLAGLTVAALYAVAAVAIAAALGVSRRRWLAVIALACSVPAIFSLVGDGFIRASSSAVRHDAATEKPVRAALSVPLDRSPHTLAAPPVLPRSPPATKPVAPDPSR